jgi:ubiquinone/menaquinone biosynthesis C-methylase UbiE
MTTNNSKLITGHRAKTYDQRRTLWSLIKSRHLSLVNPKPEQRVLDVGCGTGKTLQLLHEKSRGEVRLHGLEPSSDMLREARVNLHGLGVELSEGFAQKLPYPTNHFDWVISTQVLHHLPLAEKKKMLAEMHRVLKPGGHLVLSDWGAPTTLPGRFLNLLWRNHAYVRENQDILTKETLAQAGFREAQQSMQLGVVHHLTSLG